MSRFALAIAISLFALTVGTSATQAYAGTSKKAYTKKTAVSKAASKRKSSFSRRAGKSFAKAGRHDATHSMRSVRSKTQGGYQKASFAAANPPVGPAVTAGDMAGLHLTRDPLALKSNAALVLDQNSAQVLFEKNSDIALPIASLTKLMTALVVVESRQSLDEVLEVTADDIDREKHSASRLRVGSQMTRGNMLHIALMSSENRAASALGRHYPGGLPAFVAAMNAKARALGMTATHFVDSTGLSSRNVASARDLGKLAAAAYQHAIIRTYSTDSRYAVNAGGYRLQYMNSNRLVMNPAWDIGLQKTGFINEAGRCLIMQARVEGRPVVMVFLDSKGKESRLADAGRIRKWLEVSKPQALTDAAAHQG